jgi:hypothetical protein
MNTYAIPKGYEAIPRGAIIPADSKFWNHWTAKWEDSLEIGKPQDALPRCRPIEFRPEEVFA